MSTIQRAVITGANRGMGLEIVNQLCNTKTYQEIYAVCRKTSEDLITLASKNKQIIVVEGIEVSRPEAPAKLQEIFRTNDAEPIGIDLLVNNAGAYGPPEGFQSPDSVASTQTLANINRETMMFAFQLNTLAPLFITKALLPNLKVAGVRL